MSNDPSIEQLAIHTMRTLAMDAVQKASSGHPGAAMALAPLVYSIWNHHMQFDPANSLWPNRDRFVLSNGHASMLLWSTLYLTQTQAVHDGDVEVAGITLDDIQHFRQLGSKAPGHPEHGMVSGVETTSGPLGQGCGNSVGMAIAQKWLAARYNQPGFDLFDYRVYTVCGDGDMMEGVASEAASLAGHLALDNLCWIYDNNHITIEGSTQLTFTEDVGARFAAYGWNVLRVTDANDVASIDAALDAFKGTQGRPTLIILDSHIGYGSPNKQDKAAAHGEPLGVDEIKLTKRFYGWPEEAQFLVPDGVLAHFAAGIGARGAAARTRWEALLAGYRDAHPTLAGELDCLLRRNLPAGWEAALPTFPADAKGMAGRDASSKVLNAVAPRIPWLVGGSADLGPSNKTLLGGDAGSFQAGSYQGRNLHFGIREHAMAAAVNGMALSRLRAYSGTFFVFSDYARPSIRLAALMRLPSLFIFTHDALSDGEDGPTHQTIEHLAAVRAIPNLVTFRPGDANEVVEAYRCALALRDQPALLALSRHALPTLDRTRYAAAAGTARGAYVLADAADGKPEVIILATGSELHVAVGAHEQLVAAGVRSRVVSMPSFDLFERQPAAYRESVLPRFVRARVAVEQASPFGWDRYIGPDGVVVGMTGFGESAPIGDLNKHFGFTPENVATQAQELIRRCAEVGA